MEQSVFFKIGANCEVEGEQESDTQSYIGNCRTAPQ